MPPLHPIACAAMQLFVLFVVVLASTSHFGNIAVKPSSRLQTLKTATQWPSLQSHVAGHDPQKIVSRECSLISANLTAFWPCAFAILRSVHRHAGSKHCPRRQGSTRLICNKLNKKRRLHKQANECACRPCQVGDLFALACQNKRASNTCALISDTC